MWSHTAVARARWGERDEARADLQAASALAGGDHAHSLGSVWLDRVFPGYGQDWMALLQARVDAAAWRADRADEERWRGRLDRIRRWASTPERRLALDDALIR